MLIPSPRHSTADLRFWRELEAADALAAKEQRLRDLQAESLNALIDFTLDKPPCYCGVSWGKDSVVVAHLLWCIDRSVPLIHLRPTNHNPDCDDVRDAYFAAFPGQPYSEVPVDYSNVDRSLPHDVVDELTDERWYAAIEASGAPYDNRRILGLRSDESTGRKIRFLVHGLSSKNSCCPIGNWKASNVFAYLFAQKLPVHPAYACLGAGRWPRERLRTAEIGDTHGAGSGRREWEQSYYGDELRRIEARETLLREAAQ